VFVEFVFLFVTTVIEVKNTARSAERGKHSDIIGYRINCMLRPKKGELMVASVRHGIGAGKLPA